MRSLNASLSLCDNCQAQWRTHCVCSCHAPCTHPWTCYAIGHACTEHILRYSRFCGRFRRFAITHGNTASRNKCTHGVCIFTHDGFTWFHARECKQVGNHPTRINVNDLLLLQLSCGSSITFGAPSTINECTRATCRFHT